LSTITFVINGPSEVGCRAVVVHDHLIETPSLLAQPNDLTATISNFGDEHQPKPMPPKPGSLATDTDTLLVQQTLQ
jgi:hypothetical protein